MGLSIEPSALGYQPWTADLAESLLVFAVLAFLFGAGVGEGSPQHCHQGTDPLVDCLPVLTLVGFPAGG